MLIAVQEPERIDAYVGAAQVVDWAIREERSYDWALAKAQRVGNGMAIAALEAIGRPVDGVYASGTPGVETQRRWLGSLGGVAYDPGFLMRWIMSILLRPDYPLGAKLRFSKGMRRSMDLIWPELGQRIHFPADIRRLDVPVYLFAVSADRITSLEQLRPWYEALQAPSKHLEVVEQVGHLGYSKPRGGSLTSCPESVMR